jgi:hypothetical protein
MPPNKQPPEGNAVLFAKHYEEIKRLVGQRRSKWVLSSLPFEDVSSILETRIWKKIHLYDASLPFDRWCNTLITNAISSLLRDLLLRHARPCLSSGEYGRPCCFNGGDNICNWHKNPTGIQNAHCPLYAEWEKKKGFRADISSPLSLESHVDEHHNKPSDFVDYDRHKAAIDKIMVKKLTKGDAKIYRLIYIKHWPMPRVLKALGLRSTATNKTPILITKARNRFIKLARLVLADMDFQ